MKKWNKMIAAICSASMIFVIPGTSVFADEMPEEEPVDTEASTEEVVGEQRIQVGDGVTATFDAETGAVEFYSNEGTLWNDWFDKMGLTVDAVKSIKVSSGTVYLPQDSSFIFGGKRYDESFSNPYPNLEEIDLSYFDTSHVTDMSYMFYGCSNLTTLDLSGFDTSNVENMESMFDACSSLTSLDLSNFKTSNVQYMNSMFCLCSSLTSLVINSFDTANVVYMNDMFYGCNSLISLDLSSFNTSNVKNVWDMFYNCSGLTSLDVSGFNTSSLEVMNGMFTNCSNLTSLDLSGFNTSKVWAMDYLFSGCSSLTSLNLTGFDTSNAEYIRYMFSDCSSLTSLDVSGFNTSKVVFMSYMFSGCRNLKTLDLSGFDTSKVQYMFGLFSGCSSLTTLDLSSFETLLYYEDEEIDDIFKDCANLHLLKTPKLNRDAIELPVTMFDDKGNEYTEIPASLKSTVLTRNKVNFFDVMDQTHPYYKAIYWAAEKKITGGYKDGTFGIDTPCTRGHAVMFLWKMAGAPAPAAVSRTPFPDVPKDHPYYKAVLWAKQNGITKGYTTGVNKGKFGVDDTCTRGQIMTFIWNFKNKPAPKTVSKSPFSDVPKTHPYYKAILWGSQNGVTKGYSTGPNAGKFGINDNCTRGQIVKFLYNIR